MNNNEMNKEKAIEKVTELIEQCNQALKTKKQYYSGFHSGKYFVDKNLFAKCIIDINQFLNSHQGFRLFLREFTSVKPLAMHTNYDLIKKYMHILENLKYNLETDCINFEKKQTQAQTTQVYSETGIANYYLNTTSEFEKPIAVKQNISVFEALEKEIENNFNIEDQDKLLGLIHAMEKSQHYKPTYIKHYKEFIMLAAKNIKEIAEFIPELTRFLT